MFGYIKTYIPDLRVKEYELYRAAYCGLCDSLGKKVTCTSRLSLSYDFVFLALVRMSLSKERGEIKKKRCIAHPTKKRSVIVYSAELDTAASLSPLLTYHKIKDDIADSHGVKRFLSYLALPSASRMRKKSKIIPECEEFVGKKLSELSALENEACSSPDRVADIFGEILSEIFAYGFDKNSPEGRISAEIGFHIGRFIYIIDAVDDYGKDIKSGGYNPFKEIYGDDSEKFAADTPILKDALTMTLGKVSGAVEIIDFGEIPEFGEIIKNIIYLGLTKLIDEKIKKYTDK